MVLGRYKGEIHTHSQIGVRVDAQDTVLFFFRKMIMMQKLTTLSWVRERIRKSAKSAQTDYRQMYFRYESIRDVESKIKGEGILSGLTPLKYGTDMLEDHVWIVCEKRIHCGHCSDDKHGQN